MSGSSEHSENCIVPRTSASQPPSRQHMAGQGSRGMEEPVGAGYSPVV